MAKREFLQLAHKYDRNKHRVAGWFLSEKLDGVRAFWDGGITRGLAPSQVPWANTAKHGRFIVQPVATGLWTRYGQPIQAPAWFLDQLPSFPLDGELYAGRGRFQFVTSTVKQMVPDHRWHQIKLMALDMPAYQSVFADGKIDSKPHFVKIFEGCFNFAMSKLHSGVLGITPSSFETTYNRLLNHVDRTENLMVHQQHRLPFTTNDAHKFMDQYLDLICNDGGEGIVLRNPIYCWTPERCHHVLKLKPYYDGEATVVGYTWGKETDRGSKLLGLMGALIVNYEGKQFKVSGFEEEERVMAVAKGNTHADREAAFKYGCLHEGEVVEPDFWNPKFPPGSVVTFRYRELTDGGYPKEASYHRKHEEV